MWFVVVPIGILIYLFGTLLDVTICFLLATALRSRFPAGRGGLVTALEQVGRPLVELVSRRTRQVVTHLGGRQITEQEAQALALVVCVVVRTAVSCVVVRGR